MKRRSPEADLQIAVVEELRLRTIKPARFFFCPNGGNLSKPQAARFQRMGLTPGVPDLHFAWRADMPTHWTADQRALHLGHFGPQYGVIEMKAGRGKTSEAQAEFLTDMAILGHRYAVCNRADDFFQTLRRWGFPLR